MNPIVKVALLFCLSLSSKGIAAEENQELDSEALNGKRLFNTYCLACHAGQLPEAPQIHALKLYTPQRIIESLNSGVMSTQGLLLSGKEMLDVAYYLTNKKAADAEPQPEMARCSASLNSDESVVGDGTSVWLNWGGKHNSRFQPHETLLTPTSVGKLSLKWAFGFPQTTRVRSQPIVTKQAIYVGSQAGTVYALEPDSGCIYWQFNAAAEVRGSLQLVEDTGAGSKLVFGDFKANAYALDAMTGELIWQTKVHDHPLATITGSVKADAKRVYVPVSSSEVVSAAHPSYVCCTFRGALAAIDLHTGDLLWRSYTTSEPQLRGKNRVGVDSFGPSGAPIWSTPTIDSKRGLVYVTTGQNYSSPATGTSDAVIAIDSESGDVKWVSQVLAGDAWNGACGRKTANCPDEDGPDFDLGASAILTSTQSGQELILVGQKSGLVFAMDPNQEGKVLWEQRAGSGGTMGGVHWGMTSDTNRLYVGISDLPTNNPAKVGEPRPGVHALEPETGEFIWRTEFPDVCPSGLKFHCFRGVSAAISSSPGLVFAGGLDGMLRALSSESGEILWEYSTLGTYSTVNGISGTGGAIEADGPIIADGRVYVTSGYDKWGEMPGNVLLVFSLEGK